ncbi:SMC-Scp complex subunit ScpB [Lentilactobacillus buchneri]|uniref:Segregation and condensation protein B n=2 Tax=Lentilactobacillus buchneri TaxID=1581 RepID=J9W5C7_LENBU|nr:SMC-Scp complex subunit ScpB [Lentilactobacillus buchneri]MCC6100328.1 SMC-Scp complex subunit ScpB [Lactobacillus sp.]AEB73294.1 chromosome segregation and condensation protein, ScpB [Lentilactobacillus buchneri NRRL B-30929]AFS00210.1 segregation and condensation protein B [Lentilactobacillus buchneri subsp. silagei CD034]MCT2881858.1 SMC-Scp complex subunit ScpB [Lentilactobacillus buchneri]MCT2899561.1 SMC-Scp complex subunit ScpB [Lentilactobacillus buchneri]
MISNLAKIEALLYASGDQGITLRQMSQRTALTVAACRQLLEKIVQKYSQDQDSGLKVFVSDNVYRLGTKEELSELVGDYVNDAKPRVLSEAALETISIIMYNQPITRIEIDQIRGVNSSAILHRLVNQDLIEVTGVKEEVGNPKQYGITNFGLDYFGLKSLKDLPPLPKDEVLDDDTSDSLLTRFNKEIDKEN